MESMDGLYSLITPAEFQAVLGIDEREARLTRFVLLTATLSIEQYCTRRFLKKVHWERFEFSGDYIFPLRSYPVREVLGVWAGRRWAGGVKREEGGDGSDEATGWALVEPELYCTLPDCGMDEDVPFCLSVSPGLRLIRGVSVVKVSYWAGYACGEVPPDLASACLELAAWNMSRYRGRRIGITGNVRGSGKDGEHLEASMPENVRLLLEPYRRRVI